MRLPAVAPGVRELGEEHRVLGLDLVHGPPEDVDLTRGTGEEGSGTGMPRVVEGRLGEGEGGAGRGRGGEGEACTCAADSISTADVSRAAVNVPLRSLSWLRNAASAAFSVSIVAWCCCVASCALANRVCSRPSLPRDSSSRACHVAPRQGGSKQSEASSRKEAGGSKQQEGSRRKQAAGSKQSGSDVESRESVGACAPAARLQLRLRVCRISQPGL